MANNVVIIESDNSWKHCDITGSLNEYIFHKISIYRNRIFQIDGISQQSFTFGEVFDNAKRLAASLQHLGVLPGETISVSCENRLEYSVVMLASIFRGTVFAPINPSYSTGEIIHILSISKPRIIFCSALTLKNISLALPSLKGVQKVVVFDDSNVSSTTSLLKYTTLLEAQPINTPYPCKDSDVAITLTSSGTTGLPKGVMLSYKNLKYLVHFTRGKEQMNLTQDCIILGLIPLYHGYGYTMLLSTCVIGAKLVLLPKFEDKLFLSTIQKYKITNLHLVPPLMVFLAKHPMVLQYDLTSVREVVCGAAPLSEEIIPQFQSRLPSADIRQGYGMTELSVVVTITPPSSNKAESIGKLAPGLEAKVLDLDSGQPLGRNKKGELCLRGDCVMAGYCNNDQATRETVDTEGWLHTGDVAYVDQHGYFYIVDRIKELIKYKGFQVAPAELESILMGMPGVSDAAVVGVPDLTAGELPVAYIVRQPQATVTREDIISWVNGQVSPQKRLRGVLFTDLIPRNPSGKILRRLLKKPLNAKL